MQPWIPEAIHDYHNRYSELNAKILIVDVTAANVRLMERILAIQGSWGSYWE